MITPDQTQRVARAREVRHDVVAQLTAGIHRTFTLLFTIQWAVALVLAWKTASAGESRLGVTFVLGGMLCIPPILFARAAPFAWWSRHFAAGCQMAWSTLFMWLLEGSPEAQFHMFVSLAFLAFYRDSKVLLTATLASMVYPVIRILTLPDNFVIGASAWWRIFDHSLWVAAEAAILTFTVNQSMKTVSNFAYLIADLQLTNEGTAAEMTARTAELVRSREQFRAIAESTRAIPFELDLAHGKFLYVGPQAETILGIPAAHWKHSGFLDLLLPREREGAARRELDECMPGTFEIECSVLTADDRLIEQRWTMSCDLVDDMRVLRGLMIDVTGARRREQELAHPEKPVVADVDLNRTIRTTLNMARNEYKTVAEIETDLGDVPAVRCHAGDINQVVLNLIINAAHAIHDVVDGTSKKGRITVRTRAMGDFVEISVRDTGDGIPDAVRARLFEPFVSTKEVGRGAGQGLALSRGIVVEKLKGSLHFETETGKGTTFYIRLPSDKESTNKQAAA